MTSPEFETVVGLEVHAQLSTKSKIFCSDSTSFGADPNTQVSPVSLAYPGTLPVMNSEVLNYALKLGLALNCTINRKSYFERKNYFYPDLPKGYQVTQQAQPICIGGVVSIATEAGEKIIRLNRIHMEEDAGKSIHDNNDEYTNIDLNRAGVPLLEIVSEPDIRSGEEAWAYLTELRKIVRWIGVCDGNMEEGSMRCDANISVRRKGDQQYGTRVEVKNLNSIRHVKKAIEYEAARLINMIQNGETIQQETRSFDNINETTFSLRTKENADDYRYFPEPDLPAIVVTEKMLQETKDNLPELPEAAFKRFKLEYQLSDYDAKNMVADKDTCSFFELLAEQTNNYKTAVNWITGPVQFYCNENSISIAEFPLEPKRIAELIQLTETGSVHFNVASTKVMSALIASPSDTARHLAEEMQLIQQSDETALNGWIEEVLNSMPDKVQEYKKGKKNLQGLFAGEVKKISKGKADMQLVNKLLIERLNRH